MIIMNKETMIKDMTAKVAEVATAQEVLDILLSEIEAEQAEGKQTVAELQEQIAEAEESLQYVTDMSEAKLLKQQIKSLQEEQELTQTVAGARANNYVPEIEEKAEAFFKVHKSAKFLYGTVDNYFLAHTSLASFQEDKATMQGFAKDLNNPFKAVSQVLVDEGIAQPNKVYKGIHLGQSEQRTELEVFEAQCKLKKFVYESYKAGKLSKTW